MIDKPICGNCSHHIRDHKYANPKSLTKKERMKGLIPWMCREDCDCIEFIPSEAS